jgi:hypothetical protein
MTEQPADAVLRQKGLAALEEELGPVQALRFLAMISRQPFDYQKWRRQEFDGMSLSEVLSQASAGQH